MSRNANAPSRFLDDPAAESSTLSWFREQGLAFEEAAFDWGVLLHFTSAGPYRHLADGSLDSEHSPLVSIHLPRVRHGLLWTVGEVVFLPMPLSQFPQLASLRRSFLKWFNEQTLVYDHHPDGPHDFDYYLEGSAANWGPIRAFPSGLQAIKSERYFVSHRDDEVRLSQLCRKLSLRGLQCSPTG
jgi:hypothetical protein